MNSLSSPFVLPHQFLKIYSNTYSACPAIEQVAVYFLDLRPSKMWPMLHVFLLRAEKYAECVDKIGSAAFLHSV